MLPDQTDTPKVFISYSHDCDDHRRRVRQLADWLCEGGIPAELDQYHEGRPPGEGWPRWCKKQIKRSDFVLVICTETYLRRFEGEEEPGTGKGAKWEGFIITEELYEAEGRNEKFAPLIFCPEEECNIPDVLRSTSRYDLSTEKGWESLYRRLTDQPAVVRPKVGRIRRMPPVPTTVSEASSAERHHSSGVDVVREAERLLSATAEWEKKNLLSAAEATDLRQYIGRKMVDASMTPSAGGGQGDITSE